LSENSMVTVGIINYNCARFLKTCVNSYLNQTYPYIQILLIDDCSSDGSKEQIKELEQNSGKTFRCIYHGTNSGGPSKGIQDIIREARGKYFQWIASDDFVETDAIEQFVNYLENTNKDYVYSNLNIVNASGQITARWKYQIPERKEIVRRVFASGSGVIPMNGLYRTDFFRNKGITWTVYKENDYSCDTINSLQFLKNGITYGMIPDGLINYRIHGNNCSSDFAKRVRTSLSIYEYIIENFNEELYLPGVEWDHLANREQAKDYEIARVYYNKITRLLDGKDLPGYLAGSVANDEMRKCLGGFYQAGLKRIQEGLEQGDTLKSQLLELKEKYNSLSFYF